VASPVNFGNEVKSELPLNSACRHGARACSEPSLHRRHKPIFVARKPLTYSSTFVKFVIKYVTGKNHIAKSKFVEEYVGTIKPTKYFTFEFPAKVKCVVRICENRFCIHTFRIRVKYVSHTNPSNCFNCVTFLHLECVIYTYFTCGDATKCTENFKYAERYVSGTNEITYFEYSALTQSMSSQWVGQWVSQWVDQWRIEITLHQDWQ
jgi:hypothetical protein